MVVPEPKCCWGGWDHCLFLHWTMQTNLLWLYSFNLALLLACSCLWVWKLKDRSLNDEGIEFYDNAICSGIYTMRHVAAYYMGCVLDSSRYHYLAVKHALSWQAINHICEDWWPGHCSHLKWTEQRLREKVTSEFSIINCEASLWIIIHLQHEVKNLIPTIFRRQMPTLAWVGSCTTNKVYFSICFT